MPGRDLPTRLALQFQQLATSLHEGDEPAACVDRLVELAVDVVPRCEWASILRTRRTAGCLAHTAPPALQADELQAAAASGPAIDAANLGTVIAVSDVGADYRWPQVGPTMAEQTPVRSVLSIPVGTDAQAMSFYGPDGSALPAETLETAALFAAHAQSFLMHVDAARKALNLAEALSTSRTIGSAVGILMLAHKITSDEAFDLLRDASQRLHVKIRVLAEEVLLTGALPPLPARPAAADAFAAAAG